MTATLPTYDPLYLWIAGKRIGAAMRATRDVLNPASGEKLADLPIATDSDLEHALTTAARGYARWRAVSAYDRALVLHRAAALMRERTESDVESLNRENPPMGFVSEQQMIVPFAPAPLPHLRHVTVKIHRYADRHGWRTAILPTFRGANYTNYIRKRG